MKHYRRKETKMRWKKTLFYRILSFFYWLLSMVFTKKHGDLFTFTLQILLPGIKEWDLVFHFIPTRPTQSFTTITPEYSKYLQSLHIYSLILPILMVSLHVYISTLLLYMFDRQVFGRGKKDLNTKFGIICNSNGRFTGLYIVIDFTGPSRCMSVDTNIQEAVYIVVYKGI